jgi:hypothetical protein
LVDLSAIPPGAIVVIDEAIINVSKRNHANYIQIYFGMMLAISRHNSQIFLIAQQTAAADFAIAIRKQYQGTFAKLQFDESVGKDENAKHYKEVLNKLEKSETLILTKEGALEAQDGRIFHTPEIPFWDDPAPKWSDESTLGDTISKCFKDVDPKDMIESDFQAIDRLRMQVEGIGIEIDINDPTLVDIIMEITCCKYSMASKVLQRMKRLRKKEQGILDREKADLARAAMVNYPAFDTVDRLFNYGFGLAKLSQDLLGNRDDWSKAKKIVLRSWEVLREEIIERGLSDNNIDQ